MISVIPCDDRSGLQISAPSPGTVRITATSSGSRASFLLRMPSGTPILPMSRNARREVRGGDGVGLETGCDRQAPCVVGDPYGGGQGSGEFLTGRPTRRLCRRPPHKLG